MLGDDEMRFSDRELVNLRKEFDEYRTEQDRKFDKLTAMIEANTHAVQQLAESTQGVTQLYSDWQSTMRLGASVQRFCVALTKWGIIGAALAGGIKFTLNLFTPGT